MRYLAFDKMRKIFDPMNRWLFSLLIVSATIQNIPTRCDSHTLLTSPLKYQTRWTGFCGNSVFDNLVARVAKDDRLVKITEEPDNWRKYYRNRKNGKNLLDHLIPLRFRKYKVRHSKTQRSDNILQRLKVEPVVVRLNIVYDRSFAEEYKENKGELERYVRNLIFATQLIYEQPEMSSQVKINLVVVGINEMKLSVDSQTSTMTLLELFADGPDIKKFDKCDINMLITFSNLWGENKSVKMKLLGLAHTGIFCRPNAPGALVVNAGSLGMSVTLAHELAHTLNVLHDGDSSSIEGACDSNSNIMGPSVGPDKMTWSKCSVEAILSFFSREPEVSKCLYDPKRIASAVPLSSYFDFTNKANNSNRKKLPGEDISIDMQCSRALDRTTTSALTLKGENGDESFTTCQDLVCLLNGILPVSIGPAPSGSVCDAKNSKCYNAKCGK